MRCTRSGLLFCLALGAAPLGAQEAGSPWLRDRGEGQPTSMFGTYIQRGEWLVYPFVEYYHDNDLEYKPSELGFGLDEDFRGRYRATEGLLFLGYGLTDWLAVEFEAAIISARLTTAASDTSGVPDEIREAGLGDVEGQLRARWWRETAGRPELFSYFEAVSPQNTRRLLIGTPDWELKFGTGVVRGFSWGTMTVRAAVEYPLEEGALALGEYAVEYLRRLSPSWRIYLGIEGTQDELGLITEAQWRLDRDLTVKLNNSFGLTSKATDWAPEIGVMLSLGRR